MKKTGWVRYLLAATLPAFSQESDQLRVAGLCILKSLQSRRDSLFEVTQLGKYGLVYILVHKMENIGLFYVFTVWSD